MKEVLLRGDGLATAGCAQLLQNAGWQVLRDFQRRPKLPAVLLNGASQRLLLDVFGGDGLLRGLHRIKRRVVRWGGNTLVLPHAAVVAPEEELLNRVGKVGSVGDRGFYTIHGSGHGQEEHSFGSRIAETVSIRLREGVDEHACWVEAVESGWLFGVATGEGRAWLLSVGAGAEELLAQSCVVAKQVDGLPEERSRFAATPRISKELAGEQWLACGGAALSFDPICGEGTGHALREAILASAVLKALEAGEAAGPLQELYASRLRGGFRRHLEQCRELYAGGGTSEWWKAELASVEEGLRIVAREAQRPQRYRLLDFDIRAGA